MVEIARGGRSDKPSNCEKTIKRDWIICRRRAKLPLPGRTPGEVIYSEPARGIRLTWSKGCIADAFTRDRSDSATRQCR